MSRFDAGRLHIAAGSVAGYRYAANFDVWHADSSMVVVADGMGDSPGSRIAGRTAVDVFTTHARRPGAARPSPDSAMPDPDSAMPDPDGVAPNPDNPRFTAATLRAAVAEAQREVRAAGKSLDMLTGCTLTALVLDGDEGWIVQIGDSRAYRLRDGNLELLTVDHTAAWLGAVNGWYAFDSAEAHAARYRLFRYVGEPGMPEPDVLNVTLRPGDVYLLCTDGVAEQVSYRRLLDLLPTADPVGPLLAESLAAGGRDNATAAVIRVR